jgi:L-ascorbate metabolism protein UlaG (beta-lactamase superfamily)
MTELVFLGHAGFLLRNNDVGLLMDPWIYGFSFLGSWQIYPYENRESKLNKLYSLLDSVEKLYIWISHEHSDHFDRWFLREIESSSIASISYVIPAFPGNNLKRELAKLNISNAIELKDLDTLSISGFGELHLLQESPYYSEHSSLLAITDNLSVFHNSDSTLDSPKLQYVKTRLSSLDIYIGQYGPSSPFPHVMEWPLADKIPYIEQHIEWAFARYKAAVDILSPSLGLLCAGPALAQSLDGKTSGNYKLTPTYLSSLKGDHIIPETYSSYCISDTNHTQISRQLKSTISSKISIPSNLMLPIDRINAYISDHGFISDNATSSIAQSGFPVEYLERLKSLTPFVNRDFVFVIQGIRNIGSGCHMLSFIHSEFTYAYHTCIDEQSINLSLVNAPNYNIIRLPSAILDLFLCKRITWDEISYSRYYSIHQTIEGYMPLIIQAFRCIHNEGLYKAFLEGQLSAKSNLFLQLPYTDIDGQKCTAKIKQFCPHQNYNLKSSHSISGHVLTCPMHGHRFRLDTGECIFGDVSANILFDD